MITHPTLADVSTGITGFTGEQWQLVAVAVLFLIAAGYMARRIWRQWLPGKAGEAACAKGCGACAAGNAIQH